MRASELISKVQRLADNLGDVEVLVETGSAVVDLDRVDYDCFEPGEPLVVVLVAGGEDE